ncbi:prepilin peptidase [Ferrimonas marina]|uniref:Prepilin leader peptidase/N-methyltransferase n=1 Tax=Ferrimonas marina TaxID=299255 RepID=A0A1M5TCD3_9GAMM|nr:A24 family peptidase [Ferrimonas marina]SHH48351.1 leader peptidase (prepilin peptidase) / N-methyltransferase [Ferrimonas marina]
MATDTLIILIACVYGACVGSFLTVLTTRLPMMILGTIKSPVFDTLWGRSHCPNCNTLIPFYRNIPVVTWLFQLGRAKCCGGKIPGNYFMLEIVCAAIPGVFLLNFDTQSALTLSLFSYFALALIIIDIRHLLAPFAITIPLGVLGLVLAASGTLETNAMKSLAGALFGGGIVLVLYAIGRLTTGREWLGLGDLPLLGAVGAWVGPDGFILSWAFGLMGVPVAYLRRLMPSDPDVPEGALPMAPPILVGALITLILSELGLLIPLLEYNN